MSKSRTCRDQVSSKVVLALLAALVLVVALPVEAKGPITPIEEVLPVYALRPPYLFRHNVGLLELAITNVGVIGNPWVDQTSAGWRGGEYLYVAAMWIGAVASDNLAYVSTGAFETELRPSLDPVDIIYMNYEGCPGGNRPGFSPNRGDDDLDGLIDEDWPNGKDDDGDGLIDEDFSGISQQMFTCEYWDYTEEAINAFANHRPLNVRVRQSSYAWATEGSNEFIGFDFEVINDGFEVLRDVYLGFFVDADAGPPESPGYYLDDGGAYYLTDTTFVDPTISFTCTDRISGEEVDCSTVQLRLELCYMFDHPDDGETADGGDVDGFFGGMFLGHTTDPFGVSAPNRAQMHTARFFSGGGAYPDGDPSNDTERYDLLSDGTKPARPTGPPADYRFVFSAGPFRELRPGEHLDFQVAFVIGEGKEGMLRNAVNAQRIYNGKWRDVDEDPRTGREGRETCLVAEPGETLVWNDPCDSLNPTVRIIRETECIPGNYVDDDCNCCTPLFTTNEEAATMGLETLVNWVGTVAPPSPGTNIDPPAPNVVITPAAGDRRIVLEWDNLSELTADPIMQRILFSGYRLWRVEGWSRPVGAAGPAADDWELIADISRDPPDGLGEDSPWHVTRFINAEIDSTHPAAELTVTGSAVPGEEELWYYPVGRYVFADSLGLKNGMLYFYDVTAYSAWYDTTFADDGSVLSVQRMELAGRPTAVEEEGVTPIWAALDQLDDVYVVPNPYIKGRNPDGWDLIPSRADPTGTKVYFVGLPTEECTIDIFSLSGDLIQTLHHDGSLEGAGGVPWNLVSRNGQDIVSGVYIYQVRCGGNNKVGRFVIVR